MPTLPNFHLQTIIKDSLRVETDLFIEKWQRMAVSRSKACSVLDGGIESVFTASFGPVNQNKIGSTR